MTPRHAAVAACVGLLTAFSYLFFPGHTYLQQDSQIYLPILERLWDQSVLGQDLIAVRHHVTFTAYDELALLLRKLTGLEFEPLLKADQLFSRAIGILGVYLIATSLQLPPSLALIVAAVFTLGATIAGPAVLTVEYEPKPRTSAVPYIFLAVGLVAHRKHLLAGIAGTIAFLYHPPSAYAFWGIYFLMALWPSDPETMKRHIRGLIPLAVGVVGLFILSRTQIGGPEPQSFFGRVDPELEELQRMRASYNWISIWIHRWIWHYLFLLLVSLAALWRLRDRATSDMRFFLAGLPLIGMLSVPASHLLLEQWKWSLMPKFQPARALLFLVALAVILAACAALRAAHARKIPEAIFWAILAYVVPTHTRILDVLWPDLSNEVIRRKVYLVLLFAILAAAAGWLASRRTPWKWPAWCAALLLPFLLIPYYGKVKNYPQFDLTELDELSRWARANTPKDAVFLFADSGKELFPGMFRTKALRAIYVDWKGGGQVNTVKAFGQEWWTRWQETMAKKFEPELLNRYPDLGITHVVLKTASPLPSHTPLFKNKMYAVYSVSREH